MFLPFSEAALSYYYTDGSEGTIADASWSLPSCPLSLINGLREIVEKPSKMLGVTFSGPLIGRGDVISGPIVTRL